MYFLLFSLFAFALCLFSEQLQISSSRPSLCPCSLHSTSGSQSCFLQEASDNVWIPFWLSHLGRGCCLTEARMLLSTLKSTGQTVPPQQRSTRPQVSAVSQRRDPRLWRTGSYNLDLQSGGSSCLDPIFVLPAANSPAPCSAVGYQMSPRRLRAPRP